MDSTTFQPLSLSTQRQLIFLPQRQAKKFAGLEETWKSKDSTPKTQEEQLSVEEVCLRLRLRGEPITLYGEDEAARRARLRELEIRKPIYYDKSMLEGSKQGGGSSGLSTSGDAFQGYNFFKEMQKIGDGDDEDINLKKKKQVRFTLLHGAII